MEPIINPWLIYFIHVIDNLKLVIGGIAVIAVMLGFLLMYNFDFCKHYDSIKDISKRYSEMSKYTDELSRTSQYCFIVAFLCAILLVFVPDKDTMYTMIICKNITLDNIKALGNGFENGIDIIIEKITNAIKGGVHK